MTFFLKTSFRPKFSDLKILTSTNSSMTALYNKSSHFSVECTFLIFQRGTETDIRDKFLNPGPFLVPAAFPDEINVTVVVVMLT